MIAVRTHPPLPRRHDDGRDVVAEPARPVEYHTMHAVLAALQESFVGDGALDDDLELVLGAESALLTMDDVRRLIPRLRRTLRQLMNIAFQRADGTPVPELTDLANRASRLQAEQTAQDLKPACAQLRRLAFAVLDVLEMLTIGDDDSALPDFGASCPVPSRWSA